MNDTPGGSDRNSTPRDEDRVLHEIQSAFTMWAMSAEIFRASVEDWARLRKRHLQIARKALRAIQDLPSDQKPSAAADIVFGEVESAIKDFTAAMFRVMSFSDAVGKKFREEMRRSNPFETPSAKSEGEEEEERRPSGEEVGLGERESKH